jgi:cell division protein ZapA
MAQVNVTIGGRAFRLACNPGEESHLESLAHTVDEKIKSMRATFGEIGDQRLVVMAALTIADELHEARATVAAQLRRAEAAVLAEDAARSDAAAAARALDEMSARVEALATTLAGGGASEADYYA